MSTEAGTTTAAGDGNASPVFVDDTHRRRRRFRQYGIVAIAAFGCYLVLVVAGVTGHGPLAGIRLPFIGHAHVAAARIIPGNPPAPEMRADRLDVRLAAQRRTAASAPKIAPAAPPVTQAPLLPTARVITTPAAVRELGPNASGTPKSTTITATPAAAPPPAPAPTLPVADPGGGAANGKSAAALGHTGAPPGLSGSNPGHSGTAPGQSGTAPGQSGDAPGHAGSPPGNSHPPHGHAGK